MAKRAPILSRNYNPVGEKLRRVLETAAETTDAPSVHSESDSEGESEDVHQPQEVISEETKQEVEDNVLELPVIPTHAEKQQRASGKNAMTSELRCRCTKSERKKWHDFSMRITGAPNQFSHVFRAMLLLLEHAEDELEKQQHKLEVLENPSKQDPLAVTFYEQKLANFIWGAMRRAGRPE